RDALAATVPVVLPDGGRDGSPARDPRFRRPLVVSFAGCAQGESSPGVGEARVPRLGWGRRRCGSGGFGLRRVRARRVATTARGRGPVRPAARAGGLVPAGDAALGGAVRQSAGGGLGNVDARGTALCVR